jgi:hypothetical protein
VHNIWERDRVKLSEAFKQERADLERHLRRRLFRLTPAQQWPREREAL